MKLVIGILVILFLVLQYKLWFAQGGMIDEYKLKKQVVAQEEQNQKQAQKNNQLRADVDDLKHGKDALEERARTDLGMIKEGETFYQFVTD